MTSEGRATRRREIGVVIVIGVILVGLVIALLPSRGRENGVYPKRWGCGVNLTATVKAMIVYANENGDQFPLVPPPATPWTYSAGLGVSVAAPTMTDAAHAAFTGGAAGPVDGNPMACLWLLVLNNEIGPKVLQCNSDPAVTTRGSPTEAGAGRFYLSPASRGALSYSIAYPWNGAAPGEAAPWWRNNTDSSMPIMADMAPLNGTGSPVRDVGSTSAPTVAAMRNSFNHGGDGQNVAFGDAHVEWMRTPACGQGNDNIWTVGSDALGWGGVAPTAGRVPAMRMPAAALVPTAPAAAPYDSVMIPLRDGGTGEIK